MNRCGPPLGRAIGWSSTRVEVAGLTWRASHEDSRSRRAAPSTNSRRRAADTPSCFNSQLQAAARRIRAAVRAGVLSAEPGDDRHQRPGMLADGECALRYLCHRHDDPPTSALPTGWREAGFPCERAALHHGLIYLDGVCWLVEPDILVVGCDGHSVAVTARFSGLQPPGVSSGSFVPESACTGLPNHCVVY